MLSKLRPLNSLLTSPPPLKQSSVLCYFLSKQPYSAERLADFDEPSDFGRLTSTTSDVDPNWFFGKALSKPFFVIVEHIRLCWPCASLACLAPVPVPCFIRS